MVVKRNQIVRTNSGPGVLGLNRERLFEQSYPTGRYPITICLIITIRWLILLRRCFDAQRSEHWRRRGPKLSGGCVMEFWISWLVLCRQLFSSTSSDVETAFPRSAVSCTHNQWRSKLSDDVSHCAETKRRCFAQSTYAGQ